MRKYLLSEHGTFYKANLHCHTTFSDGNETPEEVKKAYTAKGYSIVAFTDHNVLISHSYLNDENFLALNGIEININEDEDLPEIVNKKRGQKTCHICLIAIESDNLVQPFYHREKYLWEEQIEANLREKLTFDESKPDYERVYTVEEVSYVMQEARKLGFFVTYNHPSWSLETYEQYAHYDGMHAMEIYNHCCHVLGYEAYAPTIYEDILHTGKRIYCISADDNHYVSNIGGFTMIKAEKLDYKTVTNALVEGNFYASQAPEIYKLYYENDRVYINCSKAKRISICTGRRRAKQITAPDGEFLTEASFEVRKNDIYVRLTVEDENGKHANTNAYFTDTFMQ